jgi:hypothetical protein
MSEYENLKKLIPSDLMAKIPENREHHAVWNLGDLIRKKSPAVYQAGTVDNASVEDKEELQKVIVSTFAEMMTWHVKNGFVSDAENPEELRKPDHQTDKETNRKILALVKPAYLKKIPFFVRGHATGKTCDMIAREFPELYDAFQKEPSEEEKHEMSRLINAVFEERMAKHQL